MGICKLLLQVSDLSTSFLQVYAVTLSLAAAALWLLGFIGFIGDGLSVVVISEALPLPVALLTGGVLLVQLLSDDFFNFFGSLLFPFLEWRPLVINC